MSILKSILHRWNSTNKEYDTLHPETESSQITDWHESIISSLASKVLPTVVSELTTDSVMGKLMKMLLNASGVKYSIGTNGYVCLGSFFGGLIIQWVKRDFASTSSIESFPLAFNSLCYACVANDLGGGCKILGISATSKTQYEVYQPTNNATWYGAIFLGK